MTCVYQKHKNITDTQHNKIADLLIKAGKKAYENKRMTVKIEDLKPTKTKSLKKTKSTSKRTKKASPKKIKKSSNKKSQKKPRSNKNEIKDKEKECRKNKISTVMKEFKDQKLKTRAGYIVTNPKQAIAIALSEAGRFCQ